MRGKEGRKSGKQREGRERGGGNGRKARGGNVYHLTSCEGRRGELFLMQEMLAWESQGAPGTPLGMPGLRLMHDLITNDTRDGDRKGPRTTEL